jgi:uncharacterized protein YjeT (DUF2065 family)
MLKYLLFGIGFLFLVEGLIYFFFSNKLKDFYEILSSLKKENIRSFSSILIILGLCLIYFTLKFYKL